MEAVAKDVTSRDALSEDLVPVKLLLGALADALQIGTCKGNSAKSTES